MKYVMIILIILLITSSTCAVSMTAIVLFNFSNGSANYLIPYIAGAVVLNFILVGIGDLIIELYST